MAPLKGDLTLYCYPEKMLAEIAWHAVGNFDAAKLRVKWIAPEEFVCTSFDDGCKQVSKNFGGEKEEKFYNPRDTAFSETFFPLYLEPNESMTLTSLHLYQNWGMHMTKHWSSLGAWMDYFHSSTGVTETTCYVPFKFAGIGGVAIADFRAMSQEAFWKG